MPTQEIHEGIERRREPRFPTHLRVTAHGRHGSYHGTVCEVSRSGARIAIEDPSFGLASAGSDIGLVGMRIAFHFDEGMHLHFESVEIQVDCEVARICEEEQADDCVYLGCKFLRPLTSHEMYVLGLQENPPEAAVSPSGESPGGIYDLLSIVCERGASDLHVLGGSPVRIRVDGQLQILDPNPLTQEEAEALVRQLLTEEQFERFDACGDLDIGHSLEGFARFRVNVLKASGCMGLAVRRIPQAVPTVEELGLSPLCASAADLPRGLILVTGPTGSGKSTTLAAMVQHINSTRACHILTMEDPIEYVHTEDRAHITQREIGRDTEDFASALKRALRQDPDVLLVGEMRDLETIRLAVTAAETGHLVFATLHTPSAALSISRIVDVFPSEQQRQIRAQLADSLQAIMSQMMLSRLGGGVAVAQEILVATPAVRALIREGKIPQIGNVMQTGAQEGMQTLEDVLNDMISRKLISYDTAVSKANHPRLIERRGKRLREATAAIR